MSRKTRKLIWSVPLIAAVAVIGALAMFILLTPNQAAADEREGHGEPGPVTGLMAEVATGNDANGQPAGRTRINLTWMMPDGTMGDPATSYRIDVSEDTRVWSNLLGGESGDPALDDSLADNNCGSGAADGMRCYTDTSLTPGETRHYRVFAVNDFGTSPVSIVPTYATATTTDYGRPSAVLGLTATTTLVDSIVLDWQPPTDLGGATLLWYCLAVGTSEATVPDLTDAEVEANLTGCVNVTKATEGDVDAGVARIVVPAAMTTYTQGELDVPDTISQYYRVYAVTDKDGKASTANVAEQGDDLAITDERRISLAASNTANGRTVSPLPDINTDVTTTPDPVTNLRYVSSRADDGVTLNLYWTLPANYPPALTPAQVTADATDLRARWRIEVERWVPGNGDQSGAFVTVPPAETPTSPAQWTSNGTNDAEVNMLTTAEQLFQVRYVNDPNGTPNDDDDADGIVERVRVPQATEERHDADQLPRIADTDYTSDPQTGLRFRHNGVNPTIWLDLVWTGDSPDDTNNTDTPTGYVIDYTDADAIDEHTMWKSLPNARRPSDLGATTQYTHKGVTPGKKYTYRVFPEFGSHNVFKFGYRYGLPAVEEASSREADLPDPVQGLTVVADRPDNPQTALKLTWSALSNDRYGHPIEGYLVEVANDRDNNATLNTKAPGFAWLSLAIRADPAATPPVVEKPWTVDKDTRMYTYDGTDLETADTLAGGYVRWFRVIAINAENDGDTSTGGSARDPSNGNPIDPPSPSPEESPNAADEFSAQPKDGMTDTPAAPDDPSQVMMPPAPEDLTAEQASDTNLLEPTDRGVLLLWNQPEDPDGINAYVVQRKIGTGGWTPIGRVTGRTSFTDSREYVDGEDLQYRVGSLGASTVPASYTIEVMYPTTHPEGHMPGALTAASGLSATAGSTAGTVELSWTPGNNATMHWVYAYRADEGEGGYTFKQADTNSSHILTGLDSGVEYFVGVSAGRGQLPGGEWSTWMTMRVTPN